MVLFAAGGLLIAVRGIHFAVTAVVAGILVFGADRGGEARFVGGGRKKWQTQSRRLAWIALVIALLSGVIWLLLQAISMSGLPPDEAMTSQVLWTVLNQTQFGVVTESRGVLAVILAVVPAFDCFRLAHWLALAAALGLTAAIAWTGHAASTPGELGNLHLAADVLHFVAAESRRSPGPCRWRCCSLRREGMMSPHRWRARQPGGFR